MRIGVSTGCFFPMNTVDALDAAIQTGAGVVELFLNTFSELEDGFVAHLQDKVRAAGVQVASVHPFSSAMEGFFFATPYPGRFEDGLALYRQYFEVCRALGSDKLVFHGDHGFNRARCADKSYAESFCTLAGAARQAGVTLCHENVAYCRLGQPQAVDSLRPLLGEYAAFVLDAKQARNAGLPVADMLQAMSGAVRQVHISDCDDDHSCLPPGEGRFDFDGFFAALRAAGYDDTCIIEVYSDNYDSPRQLLRAREYLESRLAGAVPTNKEGNP